MNSAERSGSGSEVDVGVGVSTGEHREQCSACGGAATQKTRLDTGGPLVPTCATCAARDQTPCNGDFMQLGPSGPVPAIPLCLPCARWCDTPSGRVVLFGLSRFLGILLMGLAGALWGPSVAWPMVVAIAIYVISDSWVTIASVKHPQPLFEQFPPMDMKKPREESPWSQSFEALRSPPRGPQEPF